MWTHAGRVTPPLGPRQPPATSPASPPLACRLMVPAEAARLLAPIPRCACCAPQPFGKEGSLANKFVAHAAAFRPRLIVSGGACSTLPLSTFHPQPAPHCPQLGSGDSTQAAATGCLASLIPCQPGLSLAGSLPRSLPPRPPHQHRCCRRRRRRRPSSCPPTCASRPATQSSTKTASCAATVSRGMAAAGGGSHCIAQPAAAGRRLGVGIAGLACARPAAASWPPAWPPSRLPLRTLCTAPPMRTLPAIQTWFTPPPPQRSFTCRAPPTDPGTRCGPCCASCSARR
jgi:hypothetical protein